MGLSSINILNSMGAGGSKYVNDTSAHTGEFTAVQFTEDSVISALTGPLENSSALISDGTTFAQGQVLFIPDLTSITLASGAAILYKR
jgi:hypothetical protein